MSEPQKYGLWAQRRGEAGGSWHRVGHATFLADTPGDALVPLSGGCDGAYIYRVTPYDPEFKGYPPEGEPLRPLRPHKPLPGHPHILEEENRPVRRTLKVPAAPVFFGGIVVATSLSPRAHDRETQQRTMSSWLKAGCNIVAVQAPGEKSEMGEWPDLTVVEARSSKVYSGAYMPISTILEETFKAARGGVIVLANADCEFVGTPLLLSTLASVVASTGGVCCLHRHDVARPGRDQGTRVESGIDAFIFSAVDIQLVPESATLCMGKPYWDYVLPLAFMHEHRPVYATMTRTLVHHVHPLRWNSDDYQRAEREAICAVQWRFAARDMLPAIQKAQVHVEIDHGPR